MQNLQITISPQQLRYNARNRPLQILFKYKRIMISTDYQLEKYQAKSKLTMRNNMLKDIPSMSQFQDAAVVKFTLSREMELMNTKVQVIMIGCEKSEVNLLGICQIDLGTFADNQNNLHVHQSNKIKYKLIKCDDQNAQLTLYVNFTPISHKANHRTGYHHDKNIHQMGILETQGYKKQSYLLNRRKNKEFPTAYEISHRNYKKVEITREQYIQEPHSRQKSIGSYKKRFEYHNYTKNYVQANKSITKNQKSVKKDKTPSHYQKKQMSKNQGSPVPRLKTPQPTQAKESPQTREVTRKRNNKTENHKIGGHKISHSHIIKRPQMQNLDLEGSSMPHNEQKYPEMSPNSEKNNKFQMITEKLKQIEMRITGKKNQVSAPATERSPMSEYQQANGRIYTEGTDEFQEVEFFDEKQDEEAHEQMPRRPKSPIQKSKSPKNSPNQKLETSDMNSQHIKSFQIEDRKQQTGNESILNQFTIKNDNLIKPKPVINQENESSSESSENSDSSSGRENQNSNSNINNNMQVSEVVHFSPTNSNKINKSPQVIYESESIPIARQSSKKIKTATLSPQEQNEQIISNRSVKTDQFSTSQNPKKPETQPQQTLQNKTTEDKFLKKRMHNQLQQCKIILKKENQKLLSQQAQRINKIKSEELEKREQELKKQYFDNLSKKEEEIVEYQHEISLLKQKLVEYEKMYSKTSTSNQVAQALQKKLQVAESTSNEYKKTNEKLERRVSSLENTIDEQEEIHRKLCMQKDFQHKKILKEKNEELSTYKEEIKRYQQENIRQKGLIDKLNEICEQSDDKNFEEIKNYEKRCMEYERKLEQAKKQTIVLKDKIQNFQNDIRTLNEQLEQERNLHIPTSPKDPQNSSPNATNLQKQVSLLSQKLKLSQQQQINIQNKLRIKQNQQRFMKIEMDNLKQEKRDLENEIDMIAVNDKYELGRKGSINKLNLESKSLFEGVRNENRVLKGEIKSLRNQVKQLNDMLQKIITKDLQSTKKLKALQNLDLKRIKQDYQVLASRYQIAQQKVQLCQQQIKRKQNKIAQIVNLIWKFGNNQLMDQIDNELIKQ